MIKGIERRFQTIGQAMYDACPKPFVRAICRSELGDGYSSTGLYALVPDGDWHFIADGLSALTSEIVALQADFVAAGEPAWTVAIAKLEESGKFSIDFSFDDVELDAFYERTKAFMDQLVSEGGRIIHPD
jgi:hypothetical protein